MSTSESDSSDQRTTDWHPQHDQAWGEVQQFVADLSELSQSETPLPQYAEAVLGKTSEILSASSGAVWTSPRAGQFSLQCRVAADPSDDLRAHETPTEEHLAFLQNAVESVAPGEIRSRETTEAGNSLITFAGVFRLDRNVAGVIEISLPGNLSDAALRGNKRLLAMVCDLMGDYLQRQQIRGLNQSHQQWNRFETLVRRAHQSLDLMETAYRLVGDGRVFVGCDRVSLAVWIRGKLTVVAISGVDTLDQRSGIVRSMTDLAGCVAKTRQWMRFRDETEKMPPPLEQAVSP